MEIFVIQKDNLREKYRLFAALLALSLPSYIQHGNRRKLCKSAGSGSRCHRNKGIISSAASYGIKLVLPALEALLILPHHIRIGFFLRSFRLYPKTQIFFNIILIGFLCIGLQNQIHAGHRKAAVLLACRT